MDDEPQRATRGIGLMEWRSDCIRLPAGGCRRARAPWRHRIRGSHFPPPWPLRP